MKITEDEFWQIQNDISIRPHFIGSLKPEDSTIIDRLRREGKSFVEQQRKIGRKNKKERENSLC